MQIRVIERFQSRLPENDDPPYRTGAWRPNQVEYDDAREIARGPIARIRLPERISSGTHACWAA